MKSPLDEIFKSLGSLKKELNEQNKVNVKQKNLEKVRQFLLERKGFLDEDFKSQEQNYINQGNDPQIVKTYIERFRKIRDKNYKQLNDQVGGKEFIMNNLTFEMIANILAKSSEPEKIKKILKQYEKPITPMNEIFKSLTSLQEEPTISEAREVVAMTADEAVSKKAKNVTVIGYHGTTPENAKQIRKDGFKLMNKRQDGTLGVSFGGAEEYAYSDKGETLKAYIKIKNPIYRDAYWVLYYKLEKEGYKRPDGINGKEFVKELRKRLIAKGHDGIIFRNQIVVLEPTKENIKLDKPQDDSNKIETPLNEIFNSLTSLQEELTEQRKITIKESNLMKVQNFFKNRKNNQ